MAKRQKKFLIVAIDYFTKWVEAEVLTTKIIKTRLEALKEQWADKLPGVLWDYRTTPRSPTGQTPFTLALCCEAVIPVEIGMVSLRI